MLAHDKNTPANAPQEDPVFRSCIGPEYIITSAEYVDRHIVGVGSARENSVLLPHKVAIDAQIRQLLEPGRDYTVRHVHHWQFPDGERKRMPYYVFHSGHTDFGVLRVSYGTTNNLLNGSELGTQPIFMIETVQGRPGIDSRRLPVASPARSMMIRHAVKSVGPLVAAGWWIGLRDSEHNGTVTEPFFMKSARGSSYKNCYYYGPGPGGHHIISQRGYYLLHNPETPEGKSVRKILKAEEHGLNTASLAQAAAHMVKWD